ncbi:ATP-binding protein [Streptomyces nogalater]|uniref:ATP-binding protein n=1 Tax=Streptomyces nogalater TaxID=38314 RepID=A0ABW0WQN4_STRNO
MDPINPGPEDHGQAHHRRPSRDPLAADLAPATPVPARMERLVCGDLQLTVNPVDGSEIEPCRPAERPGGATKRTAAERGEVELAARPPAPAGAAPAGEPVVPERREERERLARLLARGRSVRLTGPAGSGRTALLDAVAEDCRDLAPDGVVRLCGFRRAPGDLLHDLFHAVHDAPGYRPDPDELLALVREIGAVVVLDDLEFGGTALDELLDATPECAFLFGATPDVPAPSAEADVEEVFLGGLDRAAGLGILERTAGRALTEEEVNWAGDLWFESEGLPLRFVQAGALLRQRDRLRAGAGAVDEYGVFEDVRRPVEPPVESGEEVPLPSLGEAAAPAPLLASRLSRSARASLRFAVALGGEVPHQAHLPALVGDTHADAALGELVACGLVSPVGSRYRLAAGVRTQLEAAGYADDTAEHALTAARHYAWWAGHPSVTPERVCAEADAVLAALAAVVPRASSSAGDEEGGAVRLARTVAPAFAAGLHWSAWERALRSGAEAARLSGEVAEQAYFHHELGILALCSGQFGRARAELEASSGLRGALADKRGAVAGRRALALLADRAGEVPGPSVPGLPAPGPSVPGPSAPAGEEPTEVLRDVPAPYGAPGETRMTRQLTQPVPRPAAPPVPGPATRPAGRAGGLRRLARRNLVAAGAGALLAAVLGTVVTLGMTSSGSADRDPAGKVDANPSASQGVDDADPGVGPADSGGTGDTGAVGGRPASPGPDGTYGTADDPAPPDTASRPAESGEPSRPGTSSGSPSASPRPGGSGGSSTGGTTGGTPGGSTGSGGGGSTGSTGGTPTGGTTTGGSTDGSATGGTTGTGTGGTTGTTGETTGGTTDGSATGGSPTGGTTDTGGTTSGDTAGTATSGSTGGTTASATHPAPATTNPVI